jgi:hypothetical protein
MKQLLVPIYKFEDADLPFLGKISYLQGICNSVNNGYISFDTILTLERPIYKNDIEHVLDIMKKSKERYNKKLVLRIKGLSKINEARLHLETDFENKIFDETINWLNFIMSSEN